jgi:hypothetical protein
VARAGIEPATFRFSDGMKSGTYPFALVRLDQLDQQAVVEPLILRLTADNRRINSTPPRELDTVQHPCIGMTRCAALTAAQQLGIAALRPAPSGRWPPGRAVRSASA